MNTTSTPLAHHTFSPWKVDGDRRIVAAERKWKQVETWNLEAEAAGERRLVLVGVDVFEDWKWTIQDFRGNDLFVDRQGYRVDDGLIEGDRTMSMQDVRNRLFRLTDSTPNLDWLIVTNHLDRVVGLVPYDWSLPLGKGFPQNLWLGVRVSNQTEADSRIPQLLRVPAAVRFVMCDPLVGQVKLDDDCLSPQSRKKYGTDLVSTPILSAPRIDWVIVSGESGHDARPTHPDWVRSLRDQCQAAGVPFWFDGWGDWLPASHDPHNPCGIWNETDMELESLGCGGFNRPSPGTNMRLLDGRTWDEVPNQNQEI